MKEMDVRRRSNIELLRIVCMFLIVVFHCAFKSGFAFEESFSINKFVVKLFWMFGELGVNLFVLIFGYFMVNGRFKRKKLVLLIAQVLFYQAFAHAVAWKLGIFQAGGVRDTFLRLFPVTLNWYWFITAYCVVYLLSPYLNIFIRALDQRQYKKFLMTVLVLYSVIPTLFGFFYNSTETLLYYNRLIWIIVMYCVGAYVRLYPVPVIATGGRSAAFAAASFGTIAGSILFIEKFSVFFAYWGTTETAYFWPPNTVPMVCLSIGVFGIFLHLNMAYSPEINKIASTTLGIYLLHENGVLISWIWITVGHCADYYASPFLAVRILAFSFTIFLTGVVVDGIRQILEKYTLKKISDFNILPR